MLDPQGERTRLSCGGVKQDMAEEKRVLTR